MMEEVSDDTNGESTFEFVGKSDENLLKDNSIQEETKETDFLKSDPMSSLYIAPSNPQTSVFPLSTDSQLQTPRLPVTINESVIPFYDPAQYSSSNTVLMSPFQPLPETPRVTPPVSTPEHKHFMPVLQSPPVAAVPSQVFQPPPMPQQNYMEPTLPHCAVPLLESEGGPIMQGSGNESGVWGWIKGTQFLNKVAEKAKSSVDSVITTLDPGMKEIINSGGDVSVIVASGNEAKISAVREAFQLVFGKATVQGMAVQSSSIAPQPVGFSAGLKAAEERIGNLKQQGFLQGNHVILAIENFIAELTPENWFDMGCLLLQDYTSGISLQVYTEAIPISSQFVQMAKDQTPADFPLGWSGHAITIGQIVGPALGVHHSEWHQALTGVSRREILFLAAKTIAGLYKAQLRR